MKLFKSKAGFTLIELLVVIGILAVLAAIAIPSVAGLIDRANVSADKTNSNEMTNAIERFTSEYELYCQDIASGALKDTNNDGKPDDLDSAQGRVYNVTGAVTRADITALESTGLDTKQINRDTKYPLNTATLKAIIENYTKTSSATFEPKQSDCSFWYNPDCGVVVVAESNATHDKLNKLIVSGMDAKGNSIENNENWVNITNSNQEIPFDATQFYTKSYHCANIDISSIPAHKNTVRAEAYMSFFDATEGYMTFYEYDADGNLTYGYSWDEWMFDVQLNGNTIISSAGTMTITSQGIIHKGNLFTPIN